MKLDLPPFSWRCDPAVPAFEDAGPVTVMDAHCALCARSARWIARNDMAEEFTIIPLPSPLGNALMRHCGLDPEDPSTWLFLEKGRAHTSMDAIIRVGQRLGGRWKALALLRILPRPVQDALYGLVARNRYRLSGRADMCAMPNPAVQKRLLR